LRSAPANAAGWTIRLLIPGEEAAVGRVIAAAFAAKYGPALRDDPALAAALGAILPAGVPCYVGEQAGVIAGAGLLRFYGQWIADGAETAAIWRTLRTHQSAWRAAGSLLRLSLLGADGSVDRSSGYISSLAVDPAWQGQGLGGALLDHLEAVSRAAGKTRLALHVVDSNSGARRLYEQHGFRLTTTQRTLFTRPWGFGAQLYLVKPLN